MKRVTAIVIFTCLSLCFVISGIAQDAVPIEKEPMHPLKFENEFVRLFDVLVPAGKKTGFHIHSYDGLSIPISVPDLTDVSMTGEKKPLVMKFGEPAFAARPSPFTHSVINNASTDFRSIFIEILPSKSDRAAKVFPVLTDGHVVLIDNDRVRVNRLTLKPGESSKLHTHQMRGLGIIVYDPGSN